MSHFKYCTGESIESGDYILVGSKKGRISEVIFPNSQDSKDFNCFETGGVFISFDSGDMQLWPWIDEDLEFVKRG